MREKNSVLSNTWLEKKEETSILEKWGITQEQIDKARSEVMGKDNRKQIERLVAYGFSSAEIQYLEKKSPRNYDKFWCSFSIVRRFRKGFRS